MEFRAEMFIVSDLHLGGAYGEDGRRGFRIDTHANELTEFLREDLLTRKAICLPLIRE